ncbi:MAG: PIN domain-containing protein [Actinobacteria bacterium]|nr:PIN domain-containing protein [Actinomycetota bacterium]
MRRDAPRFATLLLDSDGLSKLATRQVRMRVLLERAHRLDAEVVVPWTALAETLQGPNKPAVLYALSITHLIEIAEQHYREAADLMELTGMGGHTIDALVVAAALGLSRPVVIVTSDPDDMRRLTQGQEGIAIVAV